MKILLVEPNFPIPPKSKNHAHFLPIGLLKIASYHRSLGDKIELHRGNYPAQFYPDQIK
ncbi:MAG: Fe-S oxidoreductase, partial [Parcubacteria group bacterium CG23_combo_of_CG06-09_8_20_14_all_35_9]